MQDKSYKVQKLLIVSYSNAAEDPRVLKQIRALESSFVVSIIAFGRKPDGQIHQYHQLKLPPKRLLMKEKIKHALGLLFFPMRSFFAESLSVQVEEILNFNQYDLILANDMVFATCVKNARGAQVIYDLHEYYFDRKTTLYGRLKLRSSRIAYQKFAPGCIKGITVSKGLAELYMKLSGKPLEVIHNMTYFTDVLPKDNRNNEKIRIVHPGAGMYRRNLEQLVYLVKHLREYFEIYLMLKISNEEYKKHISQIIREHGDGRVFLVDPVEYTKVPEAINQYDIGIHMSWKDEANFIHVMPNKLFEFIQGRLAVAVTPNPDIKDFVTRYDIGVVSTEISIESIAESLNALTREDIHRYKVQSDAVAKQFCAEKAQEQYLHIAESALNGR